MYTPSISFWKRLSGRDATASGSAAAIASGEAKSYFNCGAGVFPVVRRKGGKSVYRIEKLKRRELFAFYYVARLSPRRIEAGVVVGSRLEMVWVVVVAVRDDERLGAIEREGAVRFVRFDDVRFDDHDALPACDWKIACLAANRPFNVFAKR